jgi:hypothetical protein
MSFETYSVPIKALGHPTGAGGSILEYQCSPRCHRQVWHDEKMWREKRLIEKTLAQIARAEVKELERLVGVE